MDARGRAHHGQAADGVRRRALARDANPNPQSSSPLSRTLTLIRCAAEPSLMMLHTDVALVTDARFKPHVERFAKDQAAFFAAFAKASCLPPPHSAPAPAPRARCNCPPPNRFPSPPPAPAPLLARADSAAQPAVSPPPFATGVCAPAGERPRQPARGVSPQPALRAESPAGRQHDTAETETHSHASHRMCICRTRVPHEDGALRPPHPLLRQARK